MLELADDVFWVRDWRRYGGYDVDSPVPTKSLTAIYFPGALRSAGRPRDIWRRCSAADEVRRPWPPDRPDEDASMPTVAARYVELAERHRGTARFAAHPGTASAAAHARHRQGRRVLCAWSSTDGSIGFSYVLLDAAEPTLRAYPDAGAFARDGGGGARARVCREGSCRQGAGLRRHQRLVAASLLPRELDAARPRAIPWARSSRKRGEHIGMIGLFRPLVARVTRGWRTADGPGAQAGAGRRARGFSRHARPRRPGFLRQGGQHLCGDAQRHAGRRARGVPTCAVFRD